MKYYVKFAQIYLTENRFNGNYAVLILMLKLTNFDSIMNFNPIYKTEKNSILFSRK